MVGWMAPLTEAETIGYLEEKGVPVVGGLGLPSSFGPQVSFPTQANYPKAAWGVAKVACSEKGLRAAESTGQLGKVKRPLVVVLDVPYVDPAIREGLRAFKEVCGVEPIRVEKVNIATPDYTPYVLRWHYQDQADLIAAILDPGNTTRLVQAMIRQGWNPPIVVIGMADEQAVAPLREHLEKMTVGDVESQLVPSVHPDHPGARRYVTTLHRYFPGTNVASAWEISWTAAQVFVEGLRRVGPDLTRERLIQALETLREFKADLTGSLTYLPGNHDGVKCAEFLQWKDGGWKDIFNSWQCWDFDEAGRVHSYERPWW